MGVYGLASEGPQWRERPYGHVQTGIRESQVEKTQKLIPYKEGVDEIASQLLVVPASALGQQERLGEVSSDGEHCHDPPLPEDIATHSLTFYSFFHSTDILGASTLCQALC